MGGKKDKKKKKNKNVDPEKKSALKLKKEAKAERAARKRLAKSTDAVDGDGGGGGGAEGSGGGGGGDMDSLLASYRSRDAASTTLVVEALEHGRFPSPPRANFAWSAAASGGGGGDCVYLFGGEAYDGVENATFDELYRWDPDAVVPPDETEDDERGDVDDDGKSSATGGQWKLVLSPPPIPPARCSHSAICRGDGLYVFGGELAGSDRYHHYRDLWRFDLKTNLWREIVPSGGTPPTPRSGHRVVVWRHYVVLFGGFHESLSRETRWHDDLYLFDLRTERWDKPEYSKLATVPEPRSAFNFALRPGTDVAYLYGGYSKLKNRPSSSAASDPGGGGGGKGSRAEGKTHVDLWRLNLKPYLSGRPPTWERIKKRGSPPSPRSGTACGLHKNRMLIYGGVIDEEMDHHAVRSVFYDDLYSFDMEKERWSKWDVRERKKKSAKGGRRRRKKAKGDNDDDQEEEEEEGTKADDGGVVTDDEEDEEGEEVEGEEDEEATGDDDDDDSEVGWDLDRLKSDAIAFVAVDDDDGGGEEGGHARETIGGGEEGAEEEGEDAKKPSAAARNAGDAKEEEEGKGAPALAPPEEEEDPRAVVPRRRSSPLPRINASIVVRGNVLHLYGGILEIGEREVTLDDCWTLDLAGRGEGWVCLNGGTMRRQVWRGGNDDDDDESRSSALSAERHASACSGGDDSDDREQEDDDDDDGSDDEEEEATGDGGPTTEVEETEEQQKARKKAARRERKAAREKARNKERDALRATIEAEGSDRAPMPGESMAEFYARTSEVWTEAAMAATEAVKSDGGDDDGNGEKERSAKKETKREGFVLARARYDELAPALERLAVLNSKTRGDDEGGGDGNGKREKKEKKKKKEKKRR